MSVINIKCFTRSIRNRTREGFARDHSSVMIVLLLISVGFGGHVHAIPSSKGCNLPVTAFSASSTRILTPSLGPLQPIQGPICGSGSCCAPEWEHQLTSDHRNTTERYLRDAITRAASILDTRGQRVDELFRAMMNTSKIDFHTMFVKTYGMIYIENADVFEDMYKNLEIYYTHGNMLLTDMMDHFFSVLYQRMFKVINGDYEYDAKYLGCVAEHMGALKPFDDVPLKLGQQLRRSFVATRVFYKSLIHGGRVASTMLQLDLPVDECGALLTRMHNCGRCLHSDGAGALGTDASDTRACFSYCREGYTACLRDYMELGKDWDKYIDAIDKVADRLIGSFNIEMVVQPIDIKISEAIMNFQENREDITAKVFSVCGKPHLKRRRRNASTYFEENSEEQVKEIPAKKRKSQGKRKNKKTKGQHHQVTMDGFEKEISDIKHKINELRQFWSYLPYQLCNNNNGGTVAPPNTKNQCWTGTHLSNNSQPSTQAPPTTSSTSRTLIQKQTAILQTLTIQLKDAYNGIDVNYPIDDNILPPTDDGSSGDGSGDNIDSDDDIDIDLERGSGDGHGRHRPNIDTDNDDDEDNRPHRHPSPNTTERKVQLATVAPPPVIDTPPPPYRPHTTPAPSVVTVTQPQHHNDATAKTSSAPSQWELHRAILQYVMPIVAVWFGNALSTLL